jgi:hypothetical protein
MANGHQYAVLQRLRCRHRMESVRPPAIGRKYCSRWGSAGGGLVVSVPHHNERHAHMPQRCRQTLRKMASSRRQLLG